ncbi:hypothetical protein EUX98_g8472 [Antrodiella citrinella]|uniref:Uncharacterized protein n=1 Tax=Antrodiella citrinella TaxID=2447956 RepID=A0A4S4M785_9APHY|nr:hypothetical protein EUX98_g8472 [Antrodiella citrinella]
MSANPLQSIQQSAETIDRDLAQEKPLWPLSSYGPAKGAPTLVAGFDESPEELRVKAVTAMKANNFQEYTNYEAQHFSIADQAYQAARKNVQKLYEQAVQRLGTEDASTLAASGPAFGAGANAENAAFGSSTCASAPSNAFGTPSTFGALATGGPV